MAIMTRPSPDGMHPPECLGESPELQATLRAARLVAAAEVSVLIQGESGTGKELLARSIHAWSRRAAGPLVPVNCAALPEGLAESALFGHRRGAFTGATADHEGHVCAAEGGTLLLDEVAELPLALQPKLLRFLESGECQPVGASRPRRADVRVIAASHRDLWAEVEAGRLRRDLYYRLNVVPLELPPLRRRCGDVPLLLDAFTARLAARHGLEPPRLLPAARRRLEAYHWPGNVRELRNLCERLVVLFPGRQVDVPNLPREIREEGAGAGATGFELPEGGLRMDELEAALIRQALDKTGGNRSRAARLLGLSRDTLLYRIRKYAI